MNFHKKVTKNNYIREYVTVLNGLLDLTPREIDVLVSTIKIDLAWFPRSPDEVKNVLSTDNRRLIKKEIHMDKSNFNKATSKFKSMGLLIASNDGSCVVSDRLKPIITDKNKVETTFILDLSHGAVQQAV